MFTNLHPIADNYYADDYNMDLYDNSDFNGSSLYPLPQLTLQK